MNNSSAIFRSLITYSIIVPLAAVLGYLLTNPIDYSTLGTLGFLGLLLIFPLLMRWHYPWLIFCWRGSVSMFFLKGSPSSWMVLVLLSLGISVLDRILRPEKSFIRVPQITWPLIFMVVVVVFTAKLTGGFGLRAFGGEVFGGKKYLTLLVGIAGYFALTAHRIPRERTNLYVALFFLSQIIYVLADLYPLMPSFTRPLYWLIPPSIYTGGAFQIGRTRLAGFGLGGSAVLMWMMARFGIRGILLSGKKWRLLVFFLAITSMFMGGFRSSLLEFGMIFLALFYLEGLHRTRVLPAMVLVGILAMAILLPFASKLPFVVQRAMAFLPIQLSQEAKTAAEDSTKWRMDMWKALLPQIPGHLLLGKGFALTKEDFQLIGSDTAFHSADPSQQALAITSDYHNGPLSVIIPFGIWGVIAWIWFQIAGLRVMYLNYRHGDPSLRTINSFLWVAFAYGCFRFLFMGGGFASDVAIFTGLLGLSVALNNGACQPEPRSVPAKEPAPRMRPFPRPRPAFQR